MADDWKTTTLGEIAEGSPHAFVDGPFGSNLPASCYVPKGVPVIRGSNLSLGTVRFSAEEFVHVSNETADRLQRSTCKPLDIIFTKKGTLGQTGFIPDDGRHARYLLSGNQMKLTVDRAKAAPLFVYYFVSSTASRQKIVQDSEMTGVPKTNLLYLRSFPIRLPPLPEQKAIAYILGNLDDKIELNRRTNQTLEALAQALFRSWFMDPTQDGPPEGWRQGTLGDLCEIAIGGDWGEDKPFDGSTETVCLRGVDLEHLRETGHAEAPRRWVRSRSMSQRRLDERDVLVAASGAGPTGRPLWTFAELERVFGLPVIYSNFCKRLRCHSPSAAVYVDRLLHVMRESGEIWEYVNGTSIPNLDAKSLLRSKVVLIPPSELLERFYDFYHPIARRLYTGESGTLAAIRDTLLPKLLSGELRVTGNKPTP